MFILANRTSFDCMEWILVWLDCVSNISSDKIFVTTCHRQSDFIFEASQDIQYLEVGLYSRAPGMIIFLALAASDKRVTNRPVSNGNFQQLMAMLEFSLLRLFWRSILSQTAVGEDGGQNWIRTSEGVSQRIYSPPRLATSVSTLFFLRLAYLMGEA